MNGTLYVVRYQGTFGFIKPWTAVRDGETYSQQFLTPSIVEGMRQKLEVSQILRHRLRHAGFSAQQEQTQPRDFTISNRGRTWTRKRSIIVRGLLLYPSLFLAFPTEADAVQASEQHLCLCRCEDIVYPEAQIQPMTAAEFDALSGVELMFGVGGDSFLVGFNRFDNGAEMHGSLHIQGNPTGGEDEESEA